ncbi:MAG: fibronectin type III domain-containing protein [candidate division WOR-3 bacterium]|nr:fibronectin type III domain-containing protein [candidate division WOR-3 bacterium]MCX7757047.1 fibronectin type III domain-containing protein [candidate division WOR-3 bacterium]MDW7987253.1 fibronectin type III domain-containing protein [candidate division WOR-3 bacterium]
MKRLTLVLGIIAILSIAAIFIGCEEITGEAPTNVTLEAATDTTVKITWTAPQTAPDKYYVYFKAVDAANYTKIAETTATSYIHDPQGKTGKYYVAAVYGSNEYNSTIVTTEPVATAIFTVWELNASGNSGYGWERSTGAGSTYSMANAANAPNVDFYITNFAPGFSATPYCIASPDQGPSDPGGVVPAGQWKVNGISNQITDPQAPLPRYIQGTTYFNYTEITSDPTYVAVRMNSGADVYYALVKITGRNTTNGTVNVETWFQKVKGLRLIQH